MNEPRDSQTEIERKTMTISLLDVSFKNITLMAPIIPYTDM